jgi:hypothetical protein
MRDASRVGKRTTLADFFVSDCMIAARCAACGYSASVRRCDFGFGAAIFRKTYRSARRNITESR